jgi:RND family efflux transporter MFP subunit
MLNQNQRLHWFATFLMWGFVVFGSGGCSRHKDTSPQQTAVEVFAAKPLKKQIVEWDEYVGRLEAVESVEVRARVSGYLDSIHFEEGQIVKKGELLCIIDPKPFTAEVSRAKADLEQARAKVKESVAVLAQSTAELKQSESRRSLAHIRFERVKALVAKNAVPQDDVDVRESESVQAEADVEAAKSKIESASAAIATAEAAVETAKAYLAIAELNLSYSEIHSPVSGRVSRRIVTEGNFISGGALQATLLTTIVSLDPIHCVFDADEQSYLKYTRLAQEGSRRSSRDVKNPVYIALADEKDDFPHKGHMDFVDNRMDLNTGTMRARAILPNPDGSLTPGLFARLRLPGSGRHEAILIPDSAIGTDQSEKYVLVVNDDDSVKRQVITLGSTAHGLRIIRKGLDGSERVVVRGVQRIRPGVKVAAKLEVIKERAEGSLPDDYQPVPKEEWLSKSPTAAGNHEASAGKPVDGRGSESKKE